MTTHEDVFARLAAADPLLHEALITDEDLAQLSSLVEEARRSGAVVGSASVGVGPTSTTTRLLHRGWTVRPAAAMAVAAAIVVAAVVLAALVAPGFEAPPAGDPPITTIVPATTTLPPTTTTPEQSVVSRVAGLAWEMRPLTDALDSGILGFDRLQYEGTSGIAGLGLFERLQSHEPWPYDRFGAPDYDCMGGWNGEQILESPGRVVAICDIGDWSPLWVRTFVFEDNAWHEHPTDPPLYSGWVTGDGEGTFGAAIDIGDGFIANGTDEYLWASADGLTWVQIPDTADVFPERSITRAIGTANGRVYIVGELDWPPDDGAGELIDRLVVWIADLSDPGGE